MALFATSAYAGVVEHDATSDLLIQQLSELTQMSKTFTPQISAITADVLTSLAKPVTDGFRAFVEKETADIQAFRSMRPVSDEAAQKQVVIEMSGLLEGMFLGPIATVIDEVTRQKSTLDDTLGKAICAYTPGGSLGLNLFC
ncbi:hypothetical protein E4T39_01927 [Aureobasidium subglaciale]|nr:hypothetical protein E4T39_01927 [Aureobasidium subglaciale]